MDNSAKLRNLDNVLGNQSGFQNTDEVNHHDRRYKNKFDQSGQIENLRNVQNNASSQNSRYFNDETRGRYDDLDNSSQNMDNAAKLRSLDNVLANQRGFQNTDEFNQYERHNRNQFDQSGKIENPRYPQNNANSQNGRNVQAENFDAFNTINNSKNFDKLNNSYNSQGRQHLKNGSDFQNRDNSKYTSNDNTIHNIGYSNHESEAFRNNQLKTNQLSNEHESFKNNVNVNTYTVNDFEVVQPSNRRKSQLELMLINAGFDMELFNDFRDELLELEKDNIIMKYKQDLMMMILKS